MKNEAETLQEVARVLKVEGMAILRAADRMNPKNPHGMSQNVLRALQEMQRCLGEGGKIVVTGVGKSGKIGEKIAATLSSTGSLAVFLHPTEGLHGDLGIVAARDVVLALSYTGNTEELVRLLPSLKRMQVPVIGLGGNSHSRLAEYCDVWIDGSVDQEACPHNLVPTSSTAVALAIGDALAIALMEMRGFDVRSFAQNHPGGGIGKRLNLRVADLMHHGEDIGTVDGSASMSEVVSALTRKPNGAILVIDGPKMLGLITDGDLRRALRHKEKFFDLKAIDVMTVKPVTIRPDVLAYSALELMENRPSQISVLPVVDENLHWRGLIRLHDLVREL